MKTFPPALLLFFVVHFRAPVHAAERIRIGLSADTGHFTLPLTLRSPP